MMKKVLFAAVVAAGAAFGATSQASAMPLANDVGAAGAQVELARYGCGPGWTPNRWGRCVRAAPPRHHWRGRHFRNDRPHHPRHHRW